MNKNQKIPQTAERLKTYRKLYGNKNRENLRHLTPGEIEKLKAQGNTAQDWNLLETAPNFSADHIYGNIFFGRCVLGAFDGEPVSHLKLPNGIYGSTIIASRIEGGSLLSGVSLLANSIVCGKAALLNCGEISAGTGCLFESGIKITVGCEIGGRDIILTPDLSFDEAVLAAMKKKAQSVTASADDISKTGCIVEPFTVIKNCGRISDSLICEGAVLDGALLVEDSAVFSSRQAPAIISDGSIVRKAVIREGCRIADMSLVEKSLISEYCTVSRHGKVSSCIVGANTEIAEGEATSALIGPFTAFHHQSLLIAALWPKGRGNIGYGANAGSNHTGRAPDQELICGEGLFIGLGTSIKFPANYEAAPYSIIATGVCTLPQRVEFPFSLINSPSQFNTNIPPSYNEIFPGWVLENSIYSVIRNEKKFKDRDRTGKIMSDCLRPEIARMMSQAKRLLADLPKKALYTDKELPQIGKNYMTAESRETGIAAYGFYIRFCIGKELWKHLQKLEKPPSSQELFNTKSRDEDWESARSLLLYEGMEDTSMETLLTEYASACKTIAQKAKLSKEKDDIRGRRIIDDYDKLGKNAGNDVIIASALARAEETAAAVNEFINRLR